jgi:hypothetical protein
MTHSNSAQPHPSLVFNLKPLFAIKDFFALLAAAFSEAKAMEQNSHKNGGNW